MATSATETAAKIIGTLAGLLKLIDGLQAAIGKLKAVGTMTVTQAWEAVQPLLTVIFIGSLAIWLYLFARRRTDEVEAKAGVTLKTAEETLALVRSEIQRMADNYTQRQTWLADQRAEIVKQVVKEVKDSL